MLNTTKQKKLKEFKNYALNKNSDWYLTWCEFIGFLAFLFTLSLIIFMGHNNNSTILMYIIDIYILFKGTNTQYNHACVFDLEPRWIISMIAYFLRSLFFITFFVNDISSLWKSFKNEYKQRAL